LGSGIVVVPLLAASVVLSVGAEKGKQPSHHRLQPLSASKAYESDDDRGEVVLEAAARRPVRESRYVCPSDMTAIGRSYCIDVYEASLVQEMPDGTEQPWPYYEMLRAVEEVVHREKGLYPNVDLYSGSVYTLLGLPHDLFTPIFAASRVAGWTAHVLEEYQDLRLIRPTAKYVGPVDLPYLPISQRG